MLKHVFGMATYDEKFLPTLILYLKRCISQSTDKDNGVEFDLLPIELKINYCTASGFHYFILFLFENLNDDFD